MGLIYSNSVCYANLWESNSPAKKKVNMIVFYEYYKLLKRVIQETPWITTETVDIYDNQLDFMADSHRIYLRPKRSKMDNWENGLFRMTAQDVEDVIKDFDDEWRQALEDITALPSGTAQTDPSDKGKDKVETQTQDTAQVPLLGEKRKDPPQVPPEA